MRWGPRDHIGLLVGPQQVQVFDLRQRRARAPAAGVAEAIAALGEAPVRLSVLLSDAFCRYAVLPRPPGVRNRAELQAAAHSRFRAIFGDVDGWSLACEASPWHEMDFVAGVDGGVLQPLLAQAAAAGHRVDSVRPLWLAWATHFGRPLQRGRHWVLAADGDSWLGVGYFDGGVCRHARALRAEPGVDAAELLARESAFVDGADAQAGVWLGGMPAPARLAGAAPVTAVPQPVPWGVAA